MMKKIVIFGASGYGLAALYSLDGRQFNMLAFIDNDEMIQGKTFYGHYVDSPENILQYDFDYVLLPIAEHAEAMQCQLKQAAAVGG